MATRVLNLIKDRDKILGFRIVCSKRPYKGVHIFDLDKSKDFYFNVERFENVKYKGQSQWEGLECSLDKFPVMSMSGKWVKLDSELFVLGRMMQGDTPIAYKIMDLKGDVFYFNLADSIYLAQLQGLINAKLVKKDNSSDFIISAIKGKMKEFQWDATKHRMQGRVLNDDKDKNQLKGNLDASKLNNSKFKNPTNYDINDRKENEIKSDEPIDNINKNVVLLNTGEREKNPSMTKELQRERYRELSILFAKKARKEITDRDIAIVVGAKTPKDYSLKIHEYLGEPLSVSDKELLQRLLDTYNRIVAKAAQNKLDVTSNLTNNSVQQAKDSSNNISNSDMARMQQLVAELAHASEVYYSGEDEIMSNFEYDKKYDELEALEKKTGVILAGSVTQNVGFEVKGKLPKVKHASRMLSLDKTKDRNDLANSLGGQPGFLGWKLDGLTIALTYENGELVSAVTRGNGTVGEDVTHNAKFFKGVPLKIGYSNRLVVRGEALISRKRFDEINAKITSIADKYKNARNLASGSVRQLDSKIAKERGVEVVAFSVYEGFDNLDNYSDKLEELEKYGFDVVPFIRVNTKDEVIKGIEYFEEKVQGYKFPTDGLVITIDNIAYGEMLGTTAKFPKNSKAFKWKDEEEVSSLIDIEWSVGRTGAITPVAIFEPVDIDGTTVQRASLHNLSVLKDLLGDNPNKGQKVWVIKSNMIIPQITKAEKVIVGGLLNIPKVCPICNQPTQIVKENDSEIMICNNSDCVARHLGSLSHFVSRDCMNIEGLSDATLEVFVNHGFIRDYKDIYHLNDYEADIIKLDGFGKGSYNKLWKAIEKSRDCELPAFIGSLGIPQMGKGSSKDVCRALDYDLEKLVDMDFNGLQGIDGVGPKTAKEIVEYFKVNKSRVLELAKEMNFKSMPKINHNSSIAGLVFCITGDVYTFKNRKELQAKIESLGAKASGSVSSKTNYLINNDVTSTSNKNQTAKKLGVPIISEVDFLKMIGE